MLFTMKSHECPCTFMDFHCQFRLGSRGVNTQVYLGAGMAPFSLPVILGHLGLPVETFPEDLYDATSSGSWKPVTTRKTKQLVTLS